MKKYRPWGPAEWALSLDSPKQWHFVGVYGTEYRSLTSWKFLTQLGVISSYQFVKIMDFDEEKYKKIAEDQLKLRAREYKDNNGQDRFVKGMNLMSVRFEIDNLALDVLNSGCSSIILDLSSFPKRFFFIILKKLMEKNPYQENPDRENPVKNLLLTYTSPSDYASNKNPLYENIQPWRGLPGFGEEETNSGLTDHLIVSMGFVLEKFQQYIKDNPAEKTSLLIPFPAPLSSLRRTWEAVATLEMDFEKESPGGLGRFKKYRVDPLDISATFDRIKSIAGSSNERLTFAPFASKPISAAMCLYAIPQKSQVSYPQPTVYNPEYSIGILHDDPVKAINAYWIKHEGENLYAI